MIRSHITPQQQDVEGAGGKAAIPAPNAAFSYLCHKKCCSSPSPSQFGRKHMSNTTAKSVSTRKRKTGWCGRFSFSAYNPAGTSNLIQVFLKRDLKHPWDNAWESPCCDWTISRLMSSCFSSRIRSDSLAHVGSSVISRPAVMSLAVRTFCLTESSSPCTCRADRFS